MSKYKSYKSVSFKEPIVLSFTIGSTSTSYIFGLSSDQTNIRSIKINTNHKFTDRKRYEPQITFRNSGSKLFISNYGDKLFGTKIEIIKKPQDASICATIEKDALGRIIIPKKDYTGNFILNDNTYLPVKQGEYVTYYYNSLDVLNDGSYLFIQTDNIQGVDQVYYKGIEYYIQDNKHEVVSSILCYYDQKVEQDVALIIDATQEDTQFLIFDYQLKRDLQANPLSQMIASQSRIVTDTHYSDNLDMVGNEHRARFVVSDQGRIISYSVWNNKENQFNLVKSFIYPQKIQGDCYITLNLKKHQEIKDITTNF